MIKFIRDKVQPASQAEKEYVMTLAKDAIKETIETDGISLFWSEPQTMARYSTQVPQEKRGEEG